MPLIKNGQLLVAGAVSQGTFKDGAVNIGVEGLQEGTITAFGAAAGSTQGGKVVLHTADDHDISISSYIMDVNEDDLLIGPATNPDLIKIAGGTIIEFTGGLVQVGVNDTTFGSVDLFGNGASSVTGGRLRLYTAADHDTTISYYALRVSSDDLWLGPITDPDSLTYDGGTGQWQFTGIGGVALTGDLTLSNALTGDNPTLELINTSTNRTSSAQLDFRRTQFPSGNHNIRESRYFALNDNDEVITHGTYLVQTSSDTDGTESGYMEWDLMLQGTSHMIMAFDGSSSGSQPEITFNWDEVDIDYYFYTSAGLTLTLAGDTGKVSLLNGTGIDEFSTDDTLGGDSDDAVPTEQAVKAYVDAQVATQIANVVEDTAPQLGGDLDTNNFSVEIDAVPGSDHEGTGTITTMTVDANTYGIASALHMDTDGNWIEANADAAATMPCGALALETGTGSKKVLLQGFMRDDTWTWTVGGLIYMSLVAGTLTQTAPSSSGEQVQIVGFATHADRMFFNPNYAMAEIA